ncbi:hypothetical protein CIRG_05576 [Coccidioides immitis RMSCC 2394]|uniref:Uncharacterized protein n=1 Tax=Coccidioides immitis RMSCC 2394 TaxID=404692 RepID=A0A0J6YDZ4_COCIT|nr:hypothetical protein CIRG_05576 [Coccidioides immitis RMSCC 2394]
MSDPVTLLIPNPPRNLAYYKTPGGPFSHVNSVFLLTEYRILGLLINRLRFPPTKKIPTPLRKPNQFADGAGFPPVRFFLFFISPFFLFLFLILTLHPPSPLQIKKESSTPYSVLFLDLQATPSYRDRPQR